MKITSSDTPVYQPRVLCLITFLCTTFLSSANAANLNVSIGEQEQQIIDLDDTLQLSPRGSSVGLSYDINDNWGMSVDFQHLSTNESQLRHLDMNLERQGYGLSASYYLEQWTFTGSFHRSDSETVITRGRTKSYLRDEKFDNDSLSALIGYSWMGDDWFQNVTFSTEYSNWSQDSFITRPSGEPNDGSLPPPSETIIRFTKGNSSSISTSYTIARMWALPKERSLILGALLSWNHLLSGKSINEIQTPANLRRPSPQRPRRLANNTSFETVSGDDSYGQVSVYLSYDINAIWSVDVDFSQDIASAYDSAQWSVGLGYQF